MKKLYVRGIISLLVLVIGGTLLFLNWKSVAVAKPVVVSSGAGGRSHTTSTCPNLFISWNLENFGKSKSPEAIAVMADVLKVADIVAIQEVTAGKEFGSRAVAMLSDTLSRKGSVWDYVVSDPTRPVSPGVERYGYLLKKGTAFSRDSAHLVSELEEIIDREPYSLTVIVRNGKPLQLFTIHTVPTRKRPENEVRSLLASHEVMNAPRAIFAGDFNLPANVTDTTFETMGYTGAIRQKTSLKQDIDARGAYMFHQYDNIYVKGIEVCESGVIDFVA